MDNSTEPNFVSTVWRGNCGSASVTAVHLHHIAMDTLTDSNVVSRV